MIRIAIIEEQEMLLGAIGSLLNLEDDMEVVGQASNGVEAISLIHQWLPDVCIMDIDMSRNSGLEAAEALTGLGCKVIILTTFARNGYYQQALKAGVTGYLLKDSPSDVLASSIRNVIAGRQVYEPELMDEVDKNQTLLLERERLSEVNVQQQNETMGAVRAYISTIMDKMKLPTG